ncbi:MAG: sulfite exporter TauE/SafE family protein [Myxococcota bacterium]|nr:sulfite exporter TauE/SafE family protein [Myxococcota bacterium]
MNEFLVYIVVGFVAQLVDGALGMAYGVACNTVLLSLGLSPLAASASVHAAEVFTTGASGIAHWRIGNIDKRLVWQLAIPGMVGGFIGAYLLWWAPPTFVRPAVSIYLLLAGAWILIKAFPIRHREHRIPRGVRTLGFFGGFLDAAGGGGWGSIVTTTLIGGGSKARYAIGSSNAAEFFVTLVISATFLVTSGFSIWPIMTGLLIGGVLAAPIAARVAKRVPERPLLFIVGTVIVLLSVRGIVNFFWPGSVP